MKKTKMIICVFSLLTILTGCTSTRCVISEFDSTGKIIRTTETHESIISSIVSSTKDKTVVAWEDGWTAYISVSSGTTEDPTPHGKIFVGQINKGMISLHKNHQNIDIADLIKTTKSNISANMSNGISSQK